MGPLVSLQMSLHSLKNKKHKKTKNPESKKIRGAKMGRSRRRLKSICPIVSLQMSLHALKNHKHKKNKEPRDYEDSRCQNGTVPEEAQIHLSYSLFANVIALVKK